MIRRSIDVVPGMEPAARRRAYRVGPRAVASRVGQRRLLESAGCIDIDELDVTRAFTDTTRAWIEERARHAEPAIASTHDPRR